MTSVHLAFGVAVMVSSALAGVVGTWFWWRVEPSPPFWVLVRIAQGLLAVQVAIGGILLALGREPPSLHILYGLLPLAVYFIAEQLRVASAETVLDGKGIENTKDVGKLPESEQRVIVMTIVRREMGVMAFASLVVALLALRAGAVSGGVNLPLL